MYSVQCTMYSVHVSVQCTVFMSVNVTEINPNLTQDGALIDICKNKFIVYVLPICTTMYKNEGYCFNYKLSRALKHLYLPIFFSVDNTVYMWVYEIYSWPIEPSSRFTLHINFTRRGSQLAVPGEKSAAWPYFTPMCKAFHRAHIYKVQRYIGTTDGAIIDIFTNYTYCLCTPYTSKNV